MKMVLIVFKNCPLTNFLRALVNKILLNIGMEFPRKCHWFLLTCHHIVISIYTYIFSFWLIGFYNPKPLQYVKEVRRYQHIRYKEVMPCLVEYLKHMFSVFKQHYTLFHTLFHPHVFQKNTNNITQTLLPNGP